MEMPWKQDIPPLELESPGSHWYMQLKYQTEIDWLGNEIKVQHL
jgi:hypothetical protein